jgi:hypothetical protein
MLFDKVAFFKDQQYESLDRYVIETIVFMEIVQQMENVFVMMVGDRKIVIKV